MPLPLLALLVGGAAGRASKKKPKPEKRIAVNGRMKKDGTRGKAFTRRASGS
jgi:hypothetical protein